MGWGEPWGGAAYGDAGRHHARSQTDVANPTDVKRQLATAVRSDADGAGATGASSYDHLSGTARTRAVEAVVGATDVGKATLIVPRSETDDAGASDEPVRTVAFRVKGRGWFSDWLSLLEGGGHADPSGTGEAADQAATVDSARTDDAGTADAVDQRSVVPRSRTDDAVASSSHIRGLAAAEDEPDDAGATSEQRSESETHRSFMERPTVRDADEYDHVAGTARTRSVSDNAGATDPTTQRRTIFRGPGVDDASAQDASTVTHSVGQALYREHADDAGATDPRDQRVATELSHADDAAAADETDQRATESDSGVDDAAPTSSHDRIYAAKRPAAATWLEFLEGVGHDAGATDDEAWVSTHGRALADDIGAGDADAYDHVSGNVRTRSVSDAAVAGDVHDQEQTVVRSELGRPVATDASDVEFSSGVAHVREHIGRPGADDAHEQRIAQPRSEVDDAGTSDDADASHGWVAGHEDVVGATDAHTAILESGETESASAADPANAVGSSTRQGDYRRTSTFTWAQVEALGTWGDLTGTWGDIRGAVGAGATDASDISHGWAAEHAEDVGAEDAHSQVADTLRDHLGRPVPQDTHDQPAGSQRGWEDDAGAGDLDEPAATERRVATDLAEPSDEHESSSTTRRDHLGRPVPQDSHEVTREVVRDHADDAGAVGDSDESLGQGYDVADDSSVTDAADQSAAYRVAGRGWHTDWFDLFEGGGHADPAIAESERTAEQVLAREHADDPGASDAEDTRHVHAHADEVGATDTHDARLVARRIESDAASAAGSSVHTHRSGEAIVTALDDRAGATDDSDHRLPSVRQRYADAAGPSDDHTLRRASAREHPDDAGATDDHETGIPKFREHADAAGARDAVLPNARTIHPTTYWLYYALSELGHRRLLPITWHPSDALVPSEPATEAQDATDAAASALVAFSRLPTVPLTPHPDLAPGDLATEPRPLAEALAGAQAPVETAHHPEPVGGEPSDRTGPRSFAGLAGFARVPAAAVGGDGFSAGEEATSRDHVGQIATRLGFTDLEPVGSDEPEEGDVASDDEGESGLYDHLRQVVRG